MNTYKKPVVTVDAGMAEGIYAASGASQGRVWQWQTGQILMEQLL